MRKFIVALIVLLTVLFVLSRFTEMQEIGAILRTGDWHYLGLALVVEALWLLNVNASYHALYRALGLREERRRLFTVATAANFVTVMTPSGGMTALAVFLGDARRRGHPVGRVTVACILYLLFDYFGLLLAVSAGLALLARQDRLYWTEIVPSALLLLLVLLLLGLLYLAHRRPRRFESLVHGAARLAGGLISRLRRRPSSLPDKASAFSGQVIEGVAALRGNPRGLGLPALLAVSNKLLLMGTLYLVFQAFNVTITPVLLVAGFSLAYLFAVVSPTPSGVGVVEGALTLALTSLGLSLESATLVALGYRGITFWVPLLIGLISFRRLAQPQEAPARAGQSTAPM